MTKGKGKHKSNHELPAVGGLVMNVLKSQGRNKHGPLQQATVAWTRAVGPEIASHAFVSAYQKGRITVVVDSPALHMELASMRAPEVFGKLQHEAGELALVVDRVNYRMSGN